jgi:hypothetical protein
MRRISISVYRVEAKWIEIASWWRRVRESRYPAHDSLYSIIGRRSTDRYLILNLFFLFSFFFPCVFFFLSAGRREKKSCSPLSDWTYPIRIGWICNSVRWKKREVDDLSTEGKKKTENRWQSSSMPKDKKNIKSFANTILCTQFHACVCINHVCISLYSTNLLGRITHTEKKVKPFPI